MPGSSSATRAEAVTLEIYTRQDKQAQRDALGQIGDALRRNDWTAPRQVANGCRLLVSSTPVTIFKRSVCAGGRTRVRSSDVSPVKHILNVSWCSPLG